ncbi:hypothetical protein J3454_03805 [Erythrobacter sp. NFXS35]|uniref:hypothetical protein n=1 Tax=Erythrobacter sp. NFXS35 TaxID=2818436 RepID=UPI0032DF02AC
MKKLLAATAAVTIAVAAPVAAQQGMAPDATQAATVQPGTVIYGSDGSEIGTVAGQEGEVVLVKVGERMVPIASAAINPGASGPMIALTRAEVVARFDQQMAAYQAEFDAALKKGAEVQTADNRQLGMIQSVSGNTVAVQGADGSMTLPKASLALNNQGKVTVRATMAQIREAMGAASQPR